MILFGFLQSGMCFVLMDLPETWALLSKTQKKMNLKNLFIYLVQFYIQNAYLKKKERI